jgi:CBS domain-containing protein
MSRYQAIPLGALRIGAVCRQPSTYNLVQLDSPAIDVMTDFQTTTPAMIRPDASVAQAASLMVSRGVRFLFVVNGDDAIIGVVTARDLTGGRATRAVRDKGGNVGDLQVEVIMTSQTDMEAMSIDAVMPAKVGDILETLRKVGRQHAIVTEQHAGSGVALVRGIFSATHIGRRLGVPVASFEVARTFDEIHAALTET